MVDMQNPKRPARLFKTVYLIPPQWARITLLEMLVAVVTNGVAAGVANAIIRLQGAGLKNGTETFAVGGNSSRITNGINVYMPVKKIPIGVQVVPNQNIHIHAQFMNEDVGNMSFGVTLVFKVPDN